MYEKERGKVTCGRIGLDRTGPVTQDISDKPESVTELGNLKFLSLKSMHISSVTCFMLQDTKQKYYFNSQF